METLLRDSYHSAFNPKHLQVGHLGAHQLDRVAASTEEGGRTPLVVFDLDATLYDILPTSLEVLRLPLAHDFVGAPLADALAEARAEPRRVESYEGLVGARERVGTSPLQERVLDELRALGYVP